MKLTLLLSLFILFNSCSNQEKVSKKTFDEITLVNKIQFYDSKLDQSHFSCGFLLKHKNDVYAVTAKHLLKIIKPENMKTLSFDNYIKKWSLYPLNKPNEVVITNTLLNENKTELLEDTSAYTDDWLVFSIKENNSKVKALEARATPLVAGEKLYAVGWTRKMENGPQRVYEFEYYKTIENRILLKEIIVPDKFGGLSGAPVVDENGAVVGIVSGGTIEPDTNKKYFYPCSMDRLLVFLDKMQQN